MKNKITLKTSDFYKLFFILLIINLFQFCSNDESSNKNRVITANEKKFYNHTGIGPVKEIILDTLLDKNMVDEGKNLFHAKCISCHIMNEERRIGPGLKGVTQRRMPEWILNQVLNPMQMVKEDSLSKELFLIYQVQMIDMGLSKEQARSILEYFRSVDAGKSNI
jgi:hypothetical protein